MDMEVFDIYKYATQGYCCTQVLLLLVLEKEDRENYDLIRAANGMCAGMQCKGTCGILSGALMVFGLYAGRGRLEDEKSPKLKSMADEFTEWFKSEFKSVLCSDLVKEDIFTDQGEIYPVKCGDMILKAYKEMQDVLLGYDFELGERDNGE
ncbi:MAG: redox-active protein [Firmicutes bacterium]|nr:redox-active protein [Bacillota bacterium]